MPIIKIPQSGIHQKHIVAALHELRSSCQDDDLVMATQAVAEIKSLVDEYIHHHLAAVIAARGGLGFRSTLDTVMSPAVPVAIPEDF